MLKKRQRRPLKHLNLDNPINVENHLSKQETRPQQWVPELELSHKDREIILSPVCWVTDSIINAAQTLLKDMYPVSGMESAACGLTMTYSVQRSEFIQILNSGDGHWVTVVLGYHILMFLCTTVCIRQLALHLKLKLPAFVVHRSLYLVGVSHPDVFVYDSMYSTAGTTLEAQIASLRCTQESVLKIKFVDVQRQSGTF